MKNKIIDQLKLLNGKVLTLIEQNNILLEQNQELQRQNNILKDFQDKIVSKLGDFNIVNSYKNNNSNTYKEKIILVNNKDIIFLHNGIKETINNLISELDKVDLNTTKEHEKHKNINVTQNVTCKTVDSLNNATENVLFQSFMYNPIQQFITADSKNLSSRLINDIKYFFSECKIVLSDNDYINFIESLSKSPKNKISSVIYNNLKYHPYLLNKLNKIVN